MRVLVDDVHELDLADPFGVAVGLDRVHRRAWWRLVSTHATWRQAELAAAELDPYRGSAILVLDHPDIVCTDMLGKPLEAVSS